MSAPECCQYCGCGHNIGNPCPPINESLSGRKPGQPTACTTAEEGGIAGATGGGQLPHDNEESTRDSAERRSPAGNSIRQTPDESNRHPSQSEADGDLKKAMEWLRSYGFNDPRRTHLCSRYVPTILSHIAGLEKQVKDLNDVEAAYQITVANLRALVNELEATQPMQWQPIETAPKGRKLILGYKNGAGMWRTIIGKYVLPGTLELTEEAIDRLNLDDGDDGTYAPEGWYETPDNAEFIDPTYETPTRWMPLPKEPK